jgi:hypothetical protein
MVTDPSNTINSIVDDLLMRATTMGQVISHPVEALDAITNAIVELGPNNAMDTLGQAGGEID